MRSPRRRLAAAAGALAAAVGAVLLVLAAQGSSSPAAAPLPISPSASPPSAGSEPASPTPTGARPIAMKPRRLLIPQLHVSAKIGAAQVVNGVLSPPRLPSVVGAWAGSAALDAKRGEVTLAGHVNWEGMGTFAFARLADLRPGAIVYTSDRAGVVTRWVVDRVSFRDKSRGVDPRAFAGSTGRRALALITCGGEFDSAAESYRSNVYAYAFPG